MLMGKYREGKWNDKKKCCMGECWVRFWVSEKWVAGSVELTAS